MPKSKKSTKKKTANANVRIQKAYMRKKKAVRAYKKQSSYWGHLHRLTMLEKEAKAADNQIKAEETRAALQRARKKKAKKRGKK